MAYLSKAAVKHQILFFSSLYEQFATKRFTSSLGHQLVIYDSQRNWNFHRTNRDILCKNCSNKMDTNKDETVKKFSTSGIFLRLNLPT